MTPDSDMKCVAAPFLCLWPRSGLSSASYTSTKVSEGLNQNAPTVPPERLWLTTRGTSP